MLAPSPACPGERRTSSAACVAPAVLRVLSVSYPAGGVLITILALLVVPGVLSSESCG